ncbi:MAG TPA: ubiquinone biosynthesis regulatory protein kinase UbiB [Gammaproteobacteria bacterium]|jgi:ubiquinone biosynthesis protein|nr:ubiquinone biosynthesis regulatory protein kinase UbiB [Gammaproteobacteria bacterium]
MIKPRQALRLIRINVVLVRHGLDEIVLATHLFRPVRYLVYLSPFYWFRSRSISRGERIRRTLEDLGPIFVKFGQVLSTRRDLLPLDIADELAKLQDQVPPFPGAQARMRIEAAFGRSIGELLQEFDETPLASASIAQVHAARLHDGREVVVKVLRPGVEGLIRTDLEVLHLIAGLAEDYWRDGRRLRPREVVAEYEKTVLDELDLMREAANAAQLKRNFEGSPLLYVPEVHWPLTRRDVMVMERIRGVPIRDLTTLRARGTDFKRLAENGVEIFFAQVFKHNFFHADMHPGNIFVDVADPKYPRYMAVDFGIIGTLSPRDQHYLAENFLAFFNRDYRRVAQLHVESGWVPSGTREDEFETAIRTVCEPIFNKPLKDISFAQLLLRLFQTARRFNMEVQPQLMLLQKTLFNIEGLGRDLYPELDLWQTAKPFLEEWTRERMSPKATLKRLLAGLPVIRELLLESPGRINAILRQMAEEAGKLKTGDAELAALKATLAARNQHLYRAAAGAALLLGGILLLGMGDLSPWLAAALSAAGGGLLLLGRLNS